MGTLSVGLSQSYYHYARQGQIFVARAIVTAPVIYSTAAGTGGPLLWNGTTNFNAVILGVTCALTVVSTVAAALGLTGNNAQTAAPTATTAIDTSACTRIGGVGPQMSVYRVGTPSVAGNFFFPLLGLSTGALTVDNELLGFIDLQGLFQVPPNSWISLAASATATTTVAQLGLVWMEEQLR